MSTAPKERTRRRLRLNGSNVINSDDATYPIASSVRGHVKEYVGNESVISQHYAFFHDKGLLTAPYYCKDALITHAGVPGSLMTVPGPCKTKMLTARPAALFTPVVTY